MNVIRATFDVLAQFASHGQTELQKMLFAQAGLVDPSLPTTPDHHQVMGDVGRVSLADGVAVRVE